MKMNKLSQTLVFLFSITSPLILADPIPEPDPLERPLAQVTDKNHVNLVSGAVSPHLETLSIGHGPFSLSHQIGSHGNYFYGYTENTHGSVVADRLPLDTSGSSFMDIKRVSTGGLSEAFEIVGNGYVSVKNDQHTLGETESSFVYTDPEGAQYVFEKNNQEGTAPAFLTEIVRSDGFTTYIERGADPSGSTYKSVKTNTGLQLKYLFNPTNTWWESHPKYIKAINNKYEYCAIQSSSCNLSENWPKVEFEWPGNLYDMVSANIDWIFTVIDPEGRKAVFEHEAYDRRSGAAGQGSTSYVPRLVKIDDSISGDRRVIEYDYENIIRGESSGHSSYDNVSEVAVVKSVISNDEEWSYGVDHTHTCGNSACSAFEKNSSGFKAIARVGVDAIKSVPTRVESHDGVVTRLRSDYQNDVTSIQYPEGNRVIYDYDSRGRLEEIRRISSDSDADPRVTTYTYPSGCPNRKTCNKPLSVEDPMGNLTEYSYHSESGHVETVTMPEDDQGVRPQTRYVYEEMNPRYYNDSGNLAQSERGVWVLTSKSECQTGPASGSGCAESGDEVVTHYGYGDPSEPRNLFLKEVVVESGGEQRRVCYQYDRLGNRIAEIGPRSNLNSCP